MFHHMPYLSGAYMGDIFANMHQIWGHQHQPYEQKYCIHTLQTTITCYWHIPMNNYSYHIVNIGQTDSVLYGNWDLHWCIYCQCTTTTHFTYYCHVCVRNKYASQTAHAWYIRDVYVYMWQILSYQLQTFYKSFTHLPCYISCYWHMSLNKYSSHIVNMGQTALNLCGHIDLALMHIFPKHNYNIYFTYYCHVCGRN